MKIVFCLLGWCIATLPVWGQDIEYPYKHDLKGSVQQCSEKKFKARFEGNKVVRGGYQEDKHLGVRVFDREGRLVEFRAQPDSSDGGQYKKWTVTYDDKGCWQQVTEYQEDGRFNARQDYTCDGRGRVTERLDYFYLYGDRPTEITTYKYDNAGRLTETHNRYGDPKQGPKRYPPQFVQDKYKHRYYTYDPNGYLVKWSIKYEGIDPGFGALASGSAEITNDAQGRPLAEYGLNDLAAKEKKTDVKKLQKEWVYNAQGQIAQLVEYRGYGGPKTTYYDYTYDDHGNWVTRTESIGTVKPGKVNATPESITIREIKYY